MCPDNLQRPITAVYKSDVESLMHTAQVSFVTTLGTDYCGLCPRCLRYEECCVDMHETLRALRLPSAGRAFRLLLSDQRLRAQQDDTIFF